MTTQDALRRLQRLACIGIAGAMRTTSTASLEALLSLLPLHIFIEKEARSAAYRLKSTGQWSTTGSVVGHTTVWKYLVNENMGY